MHAFALALLALGTAPGSDGAFGGAPTAARPLRHGASPRAAAPDLPSSGVALRLLISAVRGAGAADGAEGAARDPEELLAVAPSGEPRSSQAGASQSATVGAPLDPERLHSLAADVSAALAELAGLPVVPELAVRLAPRSSIAARARLEVDRAFPPERRALDEAVAKALGMLPPDVDLGELYWRLLADDVGGVRDSETGEIFVADDATPNLARLVLAHEHAQHIGALLDGDATGSLPLTTDERLATSAVREARNMLLVAAWVRQSLGQGDLQALSAEEQRRTRASEPLPPFVWKPVLGLYSQGQAFLARQARYGPLAAPPRPEDVARATARPPRTTEEVLHPARYWSPEEREEPTPVDFTEAPLPEGWSIVHEDSLGELVLALFTTPPDQRYGLAASALGIAQTRFTNAAADGWDGDRLVLARSGDGQFVRLATRWEDDAEAREFAAAARAVALALALQLEVEQRGFFVVVTAASAVGEDDWRALDEALRVEPA